MVMSKQEIQKATEQFRKDLLRLPGGKPLARVGDLLFGLGEIVEGEGIIGSVDGEKPENLLGLPESRTV